MVKIVLQGNRLREKFLQLYSNISINDLKRKNLNRKNINKIAKILL